MKCERRIKDRLGLNTEIFLRALCSIWSWEFSAAPCTARLEASAFFSLRKQLPAKGLYANARTEIPSAVAFSGLKEGSYITCEKPLEILLGRHCFFTLDGD
jgi:hypothetical protein